MAHDYNINTVSVQMTVTPTTVTTVVDSTIPEWAKQPEKPTYTAHEVGAYTTEEVDGKVATLKSDLEGVQEQANILESDVEGIQEQIKTEAHFKGYLSTNAKIQALVATPNDFAYSAESGTKWVYDAVEGWQDTSSPVPDQLTPASELTPLMDGVATVGTEEAYARGDHRHPTDTTRASAEEVNNLKLTIETALDNIINIQNSLIGGGSV